MDRQTDGQTSRTTTIASFSKKKILKIASCIDLKLPIVILQKSIILDMNHRITYMYINFQPIGFCRSVKTVHTNLLAKKSQVA